MNAAAAGHDRALRRTRAAAFGLLAVLLGTFIAWHLVRFNPPTAALIGALGVAPWLALLRPLWRAGPDACLGAMLLTTPYMGYGLMEVLANPGARAFAAVTAFAGLLLAVALVALLRISRRRAAAPSARTAP